MKKLVLINLVIIFSFCECNGKTKNSNTSNITKNVVSKQDSLILDKDTIIMIDPSSKTIDSLKLKLGDDFYTIADDANYYSANVIEYLDSIHKKYKCISDSIEIFYQDKKNNLIRITNKNDEPLYWSIVLFKNDTKSYQIVAYVDFKNVYKQFFGGKYIK